MFRLKSLTLLHRGNTLLELWQPVHVPYGSPVLNTLQNQESARSEGKREPIMPKGTRSHADRSEQIVKRRTHRRSKRYGRLHHCG